MKKLLSLCLALLAVLAIASCSKDKKATYRFITGGAAGTYYAFGSVIAQHASNHTDYRFVGLVGPGSQGNILALQDGTADLAFAQSDVLSYAYQGVNNFAQTGKMECFSAVAALYSEQVQIVTLDPSIKTVADLRGKTVSIGASGSGVYFNAIDILGVYGLIEQDIKATYQSFGDSADALKDGKIDAAFIVAGAPTTAVTDLATTKKVHLVSLDEMHANILIARSPYYTKSVIPKETYGLERDAQTVAVSAVIVARDDMPGEAVYSLCADIFDNAPKLASSHAKYKEVFPAYGASVRTVPYHPGAARYFAEQGLEVSTK